MIHCSRCLYALRTLWSCGLPPLALLEVTRATALAHLLYAAPGWWEFALALDRERLQCFLSKTIRMRYLPQTPPLSVIWLLLQTMVFCPRFRSSLFMFFVHHFRPSYHVALDPGLRK